MQPWKPNVAAGPVEDLMSGEFVTLMRQEAEDNPRFRIYLGMTNDLAEELEPFADRRPEPEVLPPGQTKRLERRLKYRF